MTNLRLLQPKKKLLIEGTEWQSKYKPNRFGIHSNYSSNFSLCLLHQRHVVDKNRNMFVKRNARTNKLVDDTKNAGKLCSYSNTEQFY